MSGTYNGCMCGGTYSTAKCGLIYIYIYLLKHGGPPADGGHPGGRRTGGRADAPAGSGQGGSATLRMGIHACAVGEGRMRREPQRGGREDVSTHPLLSTSERRDWRGKVWLPGHMIHSIMTRRRDGGWAHRGKGKDEG
jgi:hypothetical protein